MISYEPFWKTIERSDENWYTLTLKHHISSSTPYYYGPQTITYISCVLMHTLQE